MDEKPRKVRVKTLAELGGTRPSNWNSEGEMDHLYGREVEVTSYWDNGVYIQVQEPDHPTTWVLTHGQYDDKLNLVPLTGASLCGAPTDRKYWR